MDVDVDGGYACGNNWFVKNDFQSQKKSKNIR